MPGLSYAFSRAWITAIAVCNFDINMLGIIETPGKPGFNECNEAL